LCVWQWFAPESVWQPSGWAECRAEIVWLLLWLWQPPGLDSLGWIRWGGARRWGRWRAAPLPV